MANEKQRIDQHILETESDKYFANQVPNEWVVRKPTPDYGIDFTVETFSLNEGTQSYNPTSIRFNIQLKATTKIQAKNNFIHFSIDTATLNYLNIQSDIPLLILYSSKEPIYDEGHLFYIFIKPLIDNLNELVSSWIKQGSITVYFPLYNSFEKNVRNLPNYVKNENYFKIEKIKYLKPLNTELKTIEILRLLNQEDDTEIIAEILNSITINDRLNSEINKYVIKYTLSKYYDIKRAAISALKYFDNEHSKNHFIENYNEFSDWWLGAIKADLIGDPNNMNDGSYYYRRILNTYLETAFNLGDGIDQYFTNVFLIEFLSLDYNINISAGRWLQKYVIKCDLNNKKHVVDQIIAFNEEYFKTELKWEIDTDEMIEFIINQLELYR